MSSGGARMSSGRLQRRTPSSRSSGRMWKTSSTRRRPRRCPSKPSLITSSARTCLTRPGAPSRSSSSPSPSLWNGFRSTSSCSRRNRPATRCPCSWRRSGTSSRWCTLPRLSPMSTCRICSAPTACSRHYVTKTWLCTKRCKCARLGRCVLCSRSPRTSSTIALQSRVITRRRINCTRSTWMVCSIRTRSWSSSTRSSPTT
mmetsp:Transcript_64477/g.185341  ORF Transcript_64477/g.185341 Transcript_64477/m.185341 type:complete len:201 (-) Transcript_64477:628-1230(-)